MDEPIKKQLLHCFCRTLCVIRTSEVLKQSIVF